MATKYWTGATWILDDGTTTSAPGAADVGILGQLPAGSALPIPPAGTVSFFGITAANVATLEAFGPGTWSIVGTGGSDDTIGNLIVASGSSVSVNSTIAVKNVSISAPAAGAVTPASLFLGDGLPPNGKIDFPGQNITYTSAFNGTSTLITASAGGSVVANINLEGNVSLSGTPVSDGFSGTEIIVLGTQPFLDPPDFILDVVAANDINRKTGENIVVGNTDVQPNFYQGTALTIASSPNPATGLPIVSNVGFGGSASLPDVYHARVTYDATYPTTQPDPANAYELLPWTQTYTNGNSTITQTTPSLVGVTPPPFASNVTFSGLSSNPTFTWTYPANSVDAVYFDIYDVTDLAANGSADLVYATTLPGTANTAIVPSALNGGLTLLQGHHYTVDLYGVVARNPALPVDNANSQAWSESFFDFETEAGATVPNVYLPTITSAGIYQFSMAVTAGQTYFIDPAIATGYTYTTGAGNPNFASVVLPAIQTGSYLVTFLNNGKQETDTVAPNTVFTFPTGGVSTFTVTGISAADNLNPADATAFVTGLSFVSSGAFTGTQTPLVDAGPKAGIVAATDTLGQAVDLTSAILAQVTPGLIGDKETITATGTAADGGQLTLVNGDLTYTASSPVLNHIPANGSLTDTFSYTVTDQLGATASGTVNVTVSNPAKTINGSPFGFDNIKGGAQTNIVNAHGILNRITESGGNDVVNAGDGADSVTTGSGDVVVNLKGYLNSVSGGNGNDTVNILNGGFDRITLGSGTDTITTPTSGPGGNTFTLNGSNATLSLYGNDNIAFVQGGMDTITDNSHGFTLNVGKEGGSISLTNFLSDRDGVIDLAKGLGGFKNAKAVIKALVADGHGGTLLSLGTSGQIDFVGVAPTALTASRFQIG